MNANLPWRIAKSVTKAVLAPGLPKPLLEVWRTRDGREIPIAAMKDDHLLNTIAFLRRQAPQKRIEAVGAALDHHPELQGQAAIEALERETYRLDTRYEIHLADDHPQYRALLREAVRRDLTVPEFNQRAAEEEGRALAMSYMLQKRGF